MTQPAPAQIDLNVIAGRASQDVKLAHRVVALLQHEIISKGLPKGASLGTAAEIRARYNVGRWALREAAAILELRGIARLTRGRGGGIIVTEPDFADLVNLTLLYLYSNRSGPREIGEVRRSVLTAVVKKLFDGSPGAIDRQGEGPVDQGIGLPRILASQTGNGALELAVEFVESVREACLSAAAAPQGGQEATSLWLCVCRGDRDTALIQLDHYLARDEQRMADTWMGLPEVSKLRTGAGKLAYRLALEILRAVVEHPDRSGDLFLSEIEIGKRFDANAEIVRQAVRLIEDLGVVSPRRGRYGGLVLRPPDAASIAALIPHLLSQKRVSIETCFDAGRFLSDEIAHLAVRRLQDSGRRPGDPHSPADASHSSVMAMDHQIQAYAENALLSSIERGMGFYSYAIEPYAPAEPANAEWIMTLSRRVLDAVEAGDVEGTTAAAHERFKFMSLRFTAGPVSD